LARLLKAFWVALMTATDWTDVLRSIAVHERPVNRVCLRAAADEIERLRALIVAVADAELGDSEQVWSEALTALFAAVDR
jgi:hypothetical protein